MATHSKSLLEICLEQPILKGLVKALAEEVRGSAPSEWVTTEEAMDFLRIKSTTTLKKYRNTGEIKFTSPEGSNKILYSRTSLLSFMEKQSQ